MLGLQMQQLSTSQQLPPAMLSQVRHQAAFFAMLRPSYCSAFSFLHCSPPRCWICQRIAGYSNLGILEMTLLYDACLPGKRTNMAMLASQVAPANLAGGHFANHDGLFQPQLADLGSASVHMPPMPWGH